MSLTEKNIKLSYTPPSEEQYKVSIFLEQRKKIKFLKNTYNLQEWEALEIVEKNIIEEYVYEKNKEIEILNKLNNFLK